MMSRVWVLTRNNTATNREIIATSSAQIHIYDPQNWAVSIIADDCQKSQLVADAESNSPTQEKAK